MWQETKSMYSKESSWFFQTKNMVSWYYKSRPPLVDQGQVLRGKSNKFTNFFKSKHKLVEKFKKFLKFVGFIMVSGVLKCLKIKS